MEKAFGKGTLIITCHDMSAGAVEAGELSIAHMGLVSLKPKP